MDISEIVGFSSGIEIWTPSEARSILTAGNPSCLGMMIPLASLGVYRAFKIIWVIIEMVRPSKCFKQHLCKMSFVCDQQPEHSLYSVITLILGTGSTFTAIYTNCNMVISLYFTSLRLSLQLLNDFV